MSNKTLSLFVLAGLAVWPGGLSMSAPPQARRFQTSQFQTRRSQARSLRIKTIQPPPNAKTSYACPASCAPIPVRTLLQKNDQEYQQFFNTFKQQSKHCQKQSFRKLASELNSHRVPAAVMQAPQYAKADDKSSAGWMTQKEESAPPPADELKKLTACKGSNCLEALKEKISLLQGRLTELEYEYVPFSSAEAETEYLKLCKGCAETERRAQKEIFFTLHLLATMRLLNEDAQCRPFKPGEIRKVITGAGLAWPYQVRMEKDGTYSAILPVKFYAGEDYDGPVPRDQAPDYYMSRAQKCLAKANKKLLGPRGEKLQIVLTPPTEDIKNKCAEEMISIGIGSKYLSPTIYHYDSQIDCATITHEMLHRFGLSDTYKEESTGYFVDSKTGRLSNKVENYFNDKRVWTHKAVPAYDCRVTTEENNIMNEHDFRWHSVFDLENKKSLLEPDQFNAILYGACPINKWHNRCAVLRHKTSARDPGCLEEKKLCEKNMNTR